MYIINKVSECCASGKTNYMEIKKEAKRLALKHVAVDFFYFDYTKRFELKRSERERES